MIGQSNKSRIMGQAINCMLRQISIDVLLKEERAQEIFTKRTIQLYDFFIKVHEKAGLLNDLSYTDEDR